MLRRICPPLGLFTSLLACSGTDGVRVDPASSDAPAYDGLFDAPKTNGTAGVIYGLWGGASPFNPNDDVRWRIAPSRIQLAMRCDAAAAQSRVTVGVSVAARVTDRDVATLESRSDRKSRANGSDCLLNVTPDTLNYQLAGMKLILVDAHGAVMSLTKLSD